MFKILNTRGLGVGGKQNELIELALTFGFNGVEVDMEDLVGRHDAMGKEFACQFLQAAKSPASEDDAASGGKHLSIGTFNLPFNLAGSNEEYGASIAKADTILDLASTLGAKVCYLEVASSCEHFSFQECFENHQSRLQELSERFAASGIKIGLSLKASDGEAADGSFKFIQTAEELLTLVKAVGQPNVGLCVDTWEWSLGGGTVAQLNELGFDKVTEIRFADVSEGADKAAIKASDRTALPADVANSFSFQVAEALIAGAVETPISVSSDLSTYSSNTRDNVVKAISQQLDWLAEGKDPAVVVAEAAAEAAAEADEAEGEEGDKDAAATEPAAKEPAATPAS
jgi:sugar phosphate isomerase/epimerase